VPVAGTRGITRRDSGDELSDVDAGLGVDDSIPFAVARDRTLTAARAFAPVADHLVQALGTAGEPADHLAVQYQDGRQLSLVPTPGRLRPGLPPGARALLDRDGRPSAPWQPDSLTAAGTNGGNGPSSQSLPARLAPAPILTAARALAGVLTVLTHGLDVAGIEATTRRRLS
jgi:hypothetical protein